LLTHSCYTPSHTTAAHYGLGLVYGYAGLVCCLRPLWFYVLRIWRTTHAHTRQHCLVSRLRGLFYLTFDTSFWFDVYAFSLLPLATTHRAHCGLPRLGSALRHTRTVAQLPSHPGSLFARWVYVFRFATVRFSLVWTHICRTSHGLSFCCGLPTLHTPPRLRTLRYTLRDLTSPHTVCHSLTRTLRSLTWFTVLRCHTRVARYVRFCRYTLSTRGCHGLVLPSPRLPFALALHGLRSAGCVRFYGGYIRFSVRLPAFFARCTHAFWHYLSPRSPWFRRITTTRYTGSCVIHILPHSRLVWFTPHRHGMLSLCVRAATSF